MGGIADLGVGWPAGGENAILPAEPAERKTVDAARAECGLKPTINPAAIDLMRAFIYPQGTRVAIRAGSFPMAPDLIGKTGVVVELDDYRPGRYGVVLDQETQVRDFSEDELEPVQDT